MVVVGWEWRVGSVSFVLIWLFFRQLFTALCPLLCVGQPKEIVASYRMKKADEI